VISESHYYRRELKNIAKYLKDVRLGPQLDETSRKYFKFERGVFVGAFIVRKMLESEKLSSRGLGDLKVKVYRNVVGKANKYELRHSDETFDFENPKRARKSVQFVCNQLIHSRVFYYVTGKTNVALAMIFGSDETISKEIYEISKRDLVNLFLRVAKDKPNYIHSMIHPKTERDIVQRFRVKNKTERAIAEKKVSRLMSKHWRPAPKT
jgi:hypothetical protein